MPKPVLGQSGDNPTVCAQADVATTYVQSNMYCPNKPKQYLKVLDPVTSKWQCFHQVRFYMTVCLQQKEMGAHTAHIAHLR